MASGVVSKQILQIQFLQLHLNFSISYFSRHKLIILEPVRLTEQEDRHSLKLLWLKSASIRCIPFDLWITKSNFNLEAG